MASQSHLRPVESEPPGPPRNPQGGGPSNGGYGERLARIETRLETVATREDIADLKTMIAEKDSARSKWLIGIVATVVLGLIAACITVTVAMLQIPSS